MKNSSTETFKHGIAKPMLDEVPFQKRKKLDYYLSNFKWYRKYRKCTWYKHEFTQDALELSVTFTGTFWALYGDINRYSKVVYVERW